VIAQARAEDIVLIAGKGHETYQEIQGVKHGFSDVDHAELALHKWGVACTA
jgi:UDP-N-acetylmuramoyl-L-alanyl-D-glutamate--2,6-diaminopimelate ligase